MTDSKGKLAEEVLATLSMVEAEAKFARIHDVATDSEVEVEVAVIYLAMEEHRLGQKPSML